MGKLNWKSLVPLFLIFILFAVLRFYNLQHRTIFNWDQEQFSNQILQLVQNHEPTLLGPRVNNDFGFFLAPYFTYLLVPFYLITGLHPTGMIIFQVLINTGFFLFAYYVVSRLFSKSHALFFLFIWTISYMLQDLETITWWPILIPPAVLTLWFLESKIYKDPNNTRLWLLVGAAAGFFMNMHFQFIFVLVQLGAFGLLMNLRTKKKTSYRNLVVCAAAFLIMFTPLFIFDLRNNFLNLNLFLNYFTHTDSIYKVRYYDWTFILANLLLPFIFIKTKVAGIVAIAGLFIATIYLWKKTAGFKSVFYLTNAAMVMVGFVAFNVLSIRPSEYYFLFLVPIFVITLVDLFLTKKLKYPLIVLCLIYTFVNAPFLRDNLNSNLDSLRYKDDLVKDIKHQVGDKKFFISFDGPPGTDSGFRYLIKIHGLNSSTDGKNLQIQVKSPPPDPRYSFGGYGVIIPEELKR